MKIRPEPERIIRVDWLATASNSEKVLRDRKFIVDLACGHKAYTRNREWMICPRCTEMMRRSVAGKGEDYDSFRKGLVPDHMVWADDPMRQVHEKIECPVPPLFESE